MISLESQVYIYDWWVKLTRFFSVVLNMSMWFDSYFLQAATKKQKYEKISEKKMSTPVEVLCKVSVHDGFFFFQYK